MTAQTSIRLAPPPQVALIALGGVLFAVGRMGEIAVLIVTADVPLLIGLGLVAARLLGQRPPALA